MKRTLIIGLVAGLALASVTWVFWPAAPPIRESAVFVGYTNGAGADTALTFSSFSSLSSPTTTWSEPTLDAAILAFTNRQASPILLEPIARLEWRYHDKDEWFSIRSKAPFAPVAPGHVATLRVPVLYQGGRWRVTFRYTQCLATNSLSYRAKMLLNKLRTLISREPVPTRVFTIESDWIER